MHKYILFGISLIIIVIAGLVTANFLFPANAPKPTACTMEAKLCPDGSAVGRTGPNCEFAECPTAKLSGITGIVLLGPTCPVQRIPPDPQCADKPYQTDFIVTLADNVTAVQQFSSGPDGKFSINLPPGKYYIRSTPNAKFLPRCNESGPVEVTANKYTSINISCDTGIR